MNANGGKLPGDYVGELEKLMIAKGLLSERRATVNSLLQQESDSHDETDTESDDYDGETSRADSNATNMVWKSPKHPRRQQEL